MEIDIAIYRGLQAENMPILSTENCGDIIYWYFKW